jgi:hypothetical protein
MNRRYVRSFQFFFQSTSIQNVCFEELTIIVCEYASIITNKLISQENKYLNYRSKTTDYDDL